MKPLMAFEAAAVDHIQSLSSVGTRWVYSLDLSTWLTICRVEGFDPVAPTLEAATRFREFLIAEGKKPLTVRRSLAVMSSIYQAVLDREHPLATWNPFRRLPKPPANLFSATRAVSRADAEKLLASASKDPRDYAVMRLLYDTGLRRMSIAQLRRAHYYTRDGAAVINAQVKGAKLGEVTLPKQTVKALDDWLKKAEHSKWVFYVSKKPAKHLHPSSINAIVKAHAKRANVKHVSPHCFRAAFVTAAIDSGMPLHDVQASVHHADPKTTLRYDRGQRGVRVTEAVAKWRGQK